jgi:hypothetical protein
MRKGGLLGLRKDDVDLETRVLTIRRSHDRDTTKGGHADAIPIARELVPYLRAAIDDAPSGLVSPRADGKMMSRRIQLELVLRRALRRAKILTGYRHCCRRKGCRYVETAADAEMRRRPKCKMILWPVGEVRAIRCHHIRHTTASLMTMAGADIAAVQKIMRHTDPKTTTEFYAHLAPGYLRIAIDRLVFNLDPPDAEVAAQERAASEAACPHPNPPPRRTAGEGTGGAAGEIGGIAGTGRAGGTPGIAETERAAGAPGIAETGCAGGTGGIAEGTGRDVVPAGFAAPLLHVRGDRENAPLTDPKNPRESRGLHQSGREDSNLRHPAPKFTTLPFQAV